jgi:hypothetical protein
MRRGSKHRSSACVRGCCGSVCLITRAFSAYIWCQGVSHHMLALHARATPGALISSIGRSPVAQDSSGCWNTSQTFRILRTEATCLHVLLEGEHSGAINRRVGTSATSTMAPASSLTASWASHERCTCIRSHADAGSATIVMALRALQPVHLSSGRCASAAMLSNVVSQQ